MAAAPTTSLTHLPREIIYAIFAYLHREQLVYSFLGLNDEFASLINHHVRGAFQLRRTTAENISRYCLRTGLPLISQHLSHLSMVYPHRLCSYAQNVMVFCPHLTKLDLHYHTYNNDDVRSCIGHFLHPQLTTITLVLNSQIVGQEISYRLLKKRGEHPFQRTSTLSTLVLHLATTDELHLLARYSQSSYLPDGFYTIECNATGNWLDDSDDDLCMTADPSHPRSLFSVRQCPTKPDCLEYELCSERTRGLLSVVKCDEEEEHWIRSSILSVQRTPSNRVCSTFTLERVESQEQYGIRPCYSGAKRLQVLGRRVIVSLCTDSSISNDRFKFSSPAALESTSNCQ